ncbi:universal stress protein [Solwaraspora sp. WMMB335]|uniref:universal stress protein n=1 Tax=Solwaraspora sp. WMMB335 TaxID=3404118 RepID=UPI003B9565BC
MTKSSGDGNEGRGLILVGYDGSASADAAVEWAVAEGIRTATPVLLAYAFDWSGGAGPIVPGPAGWPNAEARRDAEAMVRVAAAEAAEAHPPADVSAVLLDGPAAVRLRERSRGATLLVVGNRGHGGFADLLLGSTSVAVSAHAHCPVVVVRGDDADVGTTGGAGDATGTMPVVVGVDGSDESLLALRFAVEQAASRGVPLRVLRAWSPPAQQWQLPPFDTREIAAAERALVDDVLGPWREKYPQVAMTAEAVGDSPGRVLVDASRTAGLVVVGSRGRGGFTGLLLGSVSQQLLHHSHCPVAVIREFITHH